MVAFVPVDDEDLGELVRTSKLAFDNDVKYGAPSAEGPSGYDSVTWHKHVWICGAKVYKIVNDDEIIGGIVIQPDPHHNPKTWYLSRLWLTPEWQDHGVGTKAEAFIESAVPTARIWKLDTAVYNKRNQHFYEKLGFKRVGVRDGMVMYDKRIDQ